MNTASCRAKIQGSLSLFSNAEHRVAVYVLEHLDEILAYNITELAEKAEASDASVLRFCRRIGYKGYQDFKIDAARDTLPAHKHLNLRFELGDSSEDICRKIFASEVEALSETLSLLNIDLLDKAALAIARAAQVEIVGSGGSAVVAQDAQHKFLKIGVKTAAFQDADIQAMSASLLGADSVVIAISHTGSNRNTINCVKMAKNQGATVIALTSQGRSPLIKLADIVLFASAKETVFKSESASGRIAQLAVIDALVAVVSLNDYNRSYKAIQTTRQATSAAKY